MNESKIKAQIVIFGCGMIGKKTFRYIGAENVTCFCDNNPALAGTECCGAPVISYAELVRRKREGKNIAVIICVKQEYYLQISEQLIKDEIYDFIRMKQVEGYGTAKHISDSALEQLTDMESRFSLAYKSLYQRYEDEKNKNAYLRRHADSSTLKPATGKLRETQLKNIKFTRQVLDFLEINCPVQCWIQDGMLLGKLRHNGFVPWDDDVDFGIMRKDLKKLISFFEEYSVCFVPDTIYADRTEASTFKQFMEIKKKYCGKYIAQYLSDVFVIYGEDEQGILRGIEFFVSDYYVNNISLEEYKTLARTGSALQNGEFKISEVIRKFDEFVNDCEYISMDETDIVMPAIDSYIFKGLWNVEFLLHKSDIYPLVEMEFEGEVLPFPNNGTRVIELSYKNWKDIPEDAGTNHMGVILED